MRRSNIPFKTGTVAPKKPRKLPLPNYENVGSLVENWTYTPSKQICFLVEDDDLKHFGIFDGDMVIIHKTSDIIEDQIMYLETENHWMLGFLYDNFGEIGSTYRDGKIDANPTYYKKGEIKMLGVVVGVIRLFKVPPPDNGQENEQDAEITVTCIDCKASLSGRRDFLRGMGWQLNKDKTQCVNCW